MNRFDEIVNIYLESIINRLYIPYFLVRWGIYIKEDFIFFLQELGQTHHQLGHISLGLAPGPFVHCMNPTPTPTPFQRLKVVK